MPTALITGASAGLGMDFARLAAKDGHDLVLVARRKDNLDKLGAELAQAHGIKSHSIAADLTDPKAPQAIFDEVKALGLSVDVLVNNAGFGSTGAYFELPLARELEMVQVNISALMALTHLFGPGMKERKSGRILNIASTAGFQPGPFMATYYASKAFVISWSEALAYELRGTGVTVTAACPGATATEFASTAGNDKSKLFTQQKPATSAEVAAFSWKAMKKGKSIAVHGAMNKIGAFGVRLSPRKMVTGIAAGLNKK
ncbi:MAG: SDR family oxidoreductase [Deltaproteobacteria bacterium]|nr:SDR family oxidoreductase [Deltaproteobacteria bacterium]